MDVVSPSVGVYYVAMRFGEKVEKLRRTRGLTQASLAARSGLKPSQISRIETGDRKGVNLENALKIARALGVNLEFLIDEAQDEPPPPMFDAAEVKLIELARLVGLEESMRRLVKAESSVEYLRPGSVRDLAPARDPR